MASKTPKTVASESSKKLTKKEVAQAYRNIRNRFKRELKQTNEKIESGTLSESGMRASMQFRDSLQESINDTYAVKSGERKGEYLTSLDRLERRANFGKEMLKTGFDSEVYRKNELFTRDINQASIGGISTKSREEVKIFYAATKDVWGGYDITKRHEMILKHYGVETLEEAWQMVFEKEEVKKALEKARQAQQKVDSESDISDGSMDTKEEQDSPDYIKELIVSLDTNKNE